MTTDLLVTTDDRSIDFLDSYTVWYIMVSYLLLDHAADNQSNFLPLPTKKAHPAPTYQTQILSYISNHFRDAHPDAFKKDVEALTAMRREWVEAKADIHPEIVRGLMRLVYR